jgi:hypothetical protein
MVKFAGAVLFVMADYEIANAMTSQQYQVLQQSLLVILSLSCLVLTVLIYMTLRGGKLGLPWIFFMIGFGAAALGGAIQLLDALKLVISQYDLRMALLIIYSGSMLSILVGLFFYKRGLQ